MAAPPSSSPSAPAQSSALADVCACMHVRTNTHACMHACMHMCVRAYVCTCTHAATMDAPNTWGIRDPRVSRVHLRIRTDDEACMLAASGMHPITLVCMGDRVPLHRRTAGGTEAEWHSFNIGDEVGYTCSPRLPVAARAHHCEVCRLNSSTRALHVPTDHQHRLLVTHAPTSFSAFKTCLHQLHKWQRVTR